MRRYFFFFPSRLNICNRRGSKIVTMAKGQRALAGLRLLLIVTEMAVRGKKAVVVICITENKVSERCRRCVVYSPALTLLSIEGELVGLYEK